MSDIIRAAEGSPAAFRLIQDYFRDIEKHFQNRESFQRESPSDGELEVIRRRWSEFSTATEAIGEFLPPLSIHIISGPDIFKAPNIARVLNERNAKTRPPSNTSTEPATRKTIMGVSTPSALPSRAPPPSDRKVPWWRAWWRRAVSCLRRKTSK
jgi:hypothetical protein